MDDVFECKMSVSFKDWFVPVSFEDWFVELNGCTAPPLVLARSRGSVVVCCGAGCVASVDEELGALLVSPTGQGNSKGGKGMSGGVGGK